MLNSVCSICRARTQTSAPNARIPPPPVPRVSCRNKLCSGKKLLHPKHVKSIHMFLLELLYHKTWASPRNQQNKSIQCLYFQQKTLVAFWARWSTQPAQANQPTSHPTQADGHPAQRVTDQLTQQASQPEPASPYVYVYACMHACMCMCIRICR
jgi:hypothetical protein